jgi:hypothetical protein
MPKATGIDQVLGGFNGLPAYTGRGVGVRSAYAAVENRVPGATCESFGQTTICTRGELLPGERVNSFFIRNGRVFRVTVGFVID